MTELLQQAIAKIKKLPPDQQDAIAARFLAELEAEREIDEEATEELLNISGFKEAFQKAQDNVRQGKVISVDQLQRKS
jgi:hypothetical protein